MKKKEWKYNGKEKKEWGKVFDLKNEFIYVFLKMNDGVLLSYYDSYSLTMYLKMIKWFYFKMLIFISIVNYSF